MRQLRERYRPRKTRCEHLRLNLLRWWLEATRYKLYRTITAVSVFPRWASVDTLWMLFPFYVIFMVVLLLRKVSFFSVDQTAQAWPILPLNSWIPAPDTKIVWKLIQSMYLVFIITQDEMKKYSVMEKKEIENISISEPHVDSYINDELWNKNTKNQLIWTISDFHKPGYTVYHIVYDSYT